MHTIQVKSIQQEFQDDDKNEYFVTEEKVTGIAAALCGEPQMLLTKEQKTA